MNIHPITFIAAAALVSAAAAGCDASAPAASGGKTAEPTGAAESSTPSAGTKHDPPIKPAAIADGHWYCDMGTVHYSRPDKGDGKCPSCGMALKQKGGAAEGQH